MSFPKEIEAKAAEAIADAKEKILNSLVSTKPCPLEGVEPELAVYRKHIQEPVRLPYKVEPKEGVERLIKGGYLENTDEVILIVHGFLNNIDTAWMHDLRKVLLDARDRLVIVVGWGKGAFITFSLPPYAQAAVNTQTVSTWLAPFVTEIKKNLKNPYIWGIGHSLGAHLMGQTGRKSGGFDRITGLDPAGPLFEEKWDIMQGLLPTDAKMVDCIHSDGFNPNLGKALPRPLAHFGTLLACGTIDFYPNFGLAPQPGIKEVLIELCTSHARAVEYFMKSITDTGAFRTDEELTSNPEAEKPVTEVRTGASSAQMGYHANKGRVTTGRFYVNVNEDCDEAGGSGVDPAK